MKMEDVLEKGLNEEQKMIGQNIQETIVKLDNIGSYDTLEAEVAK